NRCRRRVVVGKNNPKCPPTCVYPIAHISIDDTGRIYDANARVALIGDIQLGSVVDDGNGIIQTCARRGATISAKPAFTRTRDRVDTAIRCDSPTPVIPKISNEDSSIGYYSHRSRKVELGGGCRTTIAPEAGDTRSRQCGNNALGGDKTDLVIERGILPR